MPRSHLSSPSCSISGTFRHKLNEIFSRLEQELSEYLKGAQTAGEVFDLLNPEQMAVFLVSSWEGALLRMKLTRDMVPFEIFERTAFGELLMKR